MSKLYLMFLKEVLLVKIETFSTKSHSLLAMWMLLILEQILLKDVAKQHLANAAYLSLKHQSPQEQSSSH